jgi:predicted dehydrogenase
MRSNDRSRRRERKASKGVRELVFYPPLVRARELLLEGAIGRPLHFRIKVVITDHAQAWAVPDAASRWRHALAAEGRGGPMVFDHGHHMMAVAPWLFGEVRDGFACIERTETSVGVYDAPATLKWRMSIRRCTECGMFRWR